MEFNHKCREINLYTRSTPQTRHKYYEEISGKKTCSFKECRGRKNGHILIENIVSRSKSKQFDSLKMTERITMQ